MEGPDSCSSRGVATQHILAVLFLPQTIMFSLLEWFILHQPSSSP